MPAFNFPESFPQIADIKTQDNPQNLAILNGQEYFVAVFLESSNPEGGSDYTEITHQYINKILLEDYLFEFALRGYMEIYEPNYSINNSLANIINTLHKTSGADGECVSLKDAKDFNFDGSTTERVHFKFKPINSNREGGDVQENNIFEKGNQYLMMYSFFITKIEDMSSDILAQKRTRIYFQDVESRTLEMVNIHGWNSAKSGDRAGGSSLPAYPVGGAVVNTNTSSTPVNDSGVNTEATFNENVLNEVSGEFGISVDDVKLLVNAFLENNGNVTSKLGQEIVDSYLEGVNTSTSGVTKESITVPSQPFIIQGINDDDNDGVPNSIDRDTFQPNPSTYTASQTGQAIYDILDQAYTKMEGSIGEKLKFKERLPDINSEYEVTPIGNKPKYTKGVWKYDQTKKQYVSKPATYSADDHWDMGHPKSIINVSPAEYTAMELLNKHLRVHVSGVETNSENEDQYGGGGQTVGKLNLDPCLLKLNRPKNENDTPYITLRSIDSYCSNVYQDSSEQVIFDGYMGDFFFKENDIDWSGLPKKVFNKIKSAICPDLEGKTSRFKPIDHFTFERIRNGDSTEHLISHQVHNSNSRAGNYSNMVDGELSNVKYYMGEKYVKPFVDKSTYESSEFGSKLINIGDSGNTKAGNVRIRKINNDIPTECSGIALGRNSLVKKMIALNDTLVFLTTGDTSYDVGGFFSAKMMRNDNNFTYDTLDGNYMIIKNVTRIDFRDKTFSSELTGSKFFKSGISERQKKMVVEKIISDSTNGNEIILDSPSNQQSPTLGGDTPIDQRVLDEIRNGGVGSGQSNLPTATA